VHRLPRDEELLLYVGVEHLPVDLDAGTRIQDDPELVAFTVVLATKGAARCDRDDLDRAGRLWVYCSKSTAVRNRMRPAALETALNSSPVP
jgi:hypothetical protein